MANRKDLLSEAIADAKAVKETALANAKLALEEAFTPKLQSMISAKLAEEADEDMDEELDSTDLGAGDNAEPSDDANDSSEVENDDELVVAEEDEQKVSEEDEEATDETYESTDEMDEEDDLDLESVIAELEAEMANEEGEEEGEEEMSMDMEAEPAGEEEAESLGDLQEAEVDEEIEISVGDDSPDDKFIDIRTDAEKSAEEQENTPDEREEFGSGVDGDETGRNMAYQSFKKIETTIIDAYELLSNPEDQELFYDYLIANLKLYFDKFENELADSVSEPTNQAYDMAKSEEAPEEIEMGSEEDLELDF